MKLLYVPSSMYKKFFIILLCVFLGMFALEFVVSMLGHPIGTLTLNGVEVMPKTPWEHLLMAALTASFISGFVNVFLIIRIMKEALGFSHWPAALVVLMTMLFPVELLIGVLSVVPNITMFGIKGYTKKRVYEVKF